MKKILIIFVLSAMLVPLYGGPHGGRGYCGPPPRHYCHGPNNGVRLAADIVGLVGAGLNILAPRTVVVQPTPVYGYSPAYVAPAPTVVYPRPCVPVYMRPIPQPIVSPVYDSRYVFPTYPTVYRTEYYYAPPPPPRPYRYYRRW